MFADSTQYRNWMFQSGEVINQLRETTNKAFVARSTITPEGDVKRGKFLTAQEEQDVLSYFEMKMGEFCRKFKPPMPKCVMGTSFHYFKRFYLRNSVMDYHPKEVLVTAVYLATKVEEFNVSISQFVSNVQGNQERATNIILNNELLLLRELDFNLTIHNPFRAVEGLLIDIKTRCRTVSNVDAFRPEIESFLDQVYLTEAPLVYAPSQLALSAIIHAASRQKQNLDSYVTEELFAGQGVEAIKNIISCVRQIRIMVKGIGEPVKNIKALCDRLEACRNQENNPDSAAYKRKLEELVDEDDTFEPRFKAPRLDSSSELSSIRPLSSPAAS